MAKKTDLVLETSETKGAVNWMKKLAKGAVTIASAEENKPKVNILLPSPSLNWATGGGIRKGKTVMFYGPESAGKTLLAMLTVIEDQKLDENGIWIWFNAEFSFNRDHFVELGGDADRLLLVNSNHYTEIFDYFFHNIKEACEGGAPVRGAVIDSIRAIVYPKDGKFEEDSSAQHMGGVAALYLSSALKLWVGIQSKHNITTIFIQQVGVDLNMYSSEKWTTSGGKALAHACDYKILVEKVEGKGGQILSGENQVGHIIRCAVKKNRLGIPNRKSEMRFIYNKGISDQVMEVYELGKKIGVVYHPEGKGNAYWAIKGLEEMFYGEKNLIAKFVEDVTLQNATWSECMNYRGDINSEQQSDEEI